jgi:hypothetical protein
MSALAAHPSTSPLPPNTLASPSALLESLQATADMAMDEDVGPAEAGVPVYQAAAGLASAGAADRTTFRRIRCPPHR